MLSQLTEEVTHCFIIDHYKADKTKGIVVCHTEAQAKMEIARIGNGMISKMSIESAREAGLLN